MEYLAKRVVIIVGILIIVVAVGFINYLFFSKTNLGALINFGAKTDYNSVAENCDGENCILGYIEICEKAKLNYGGEGINYIEVKGITDGKCEIYLSGSLGGMTCLLPEENNFSLLFEDTIYTDFPSLEYCNGGLRENLAGSFFSDDFIE